MPSVQSVIRAIRDQCDRHQEHCFHNDCLLLEDLTRVIDNARRELDLETESAPDLRYWPHGKKVDIDHLWNCMIWNVVDSSEADLVLYLLGNGGLYPNPDLEVDLQIPSMLLLWEE